MHGERTEELRHMRLGASACVAWPWALALSAGDVAPCATMTWHPVAGQPGGCPPCEWAPKPPQALPIFGPASRTGLVGCRTQILYALVLPKRRTAPGAARRSS